MNNSKSISTSYVPTCCLPWEKNDYFLVTFVLGILLIPTASYYVYYGLLTVAYMLFAFNGKIFVNNYSVVILSLVFYLFFCAVLRVCVLQNWILKDISEIIKIAPFIFAFALSGRTRKMQLRHFVVALQMYLVLDGIVSFSQYFHLESQALSYISDIFNREGHTVALSYSSVRALGLSAGPASHGSILIFIYSVLLSVYLFGLQKRRVGIAFVLFSFSLILISQSKTAIMTSVMVTPLFILGVIAARKKINFKMILVAGGIAILVCFIATVGAGHFYHIEKIKSLLSGGSVSSFDARISLWMDYLTIAGNNPFWQLVGFGRSYLGGIGNAGRVFDNDFLYIYFVHGLIFAVIVFGFLFSFLALSVVNWRTQSIEKRVLFFALTSASVSGMGFTSLTDPKVSTLLALLISMAFIYPRGRGASYN